MKEDYAEMVIEMLCKEIDELKKELNELKLSTFGNANYIDSNGTWWVTPNTSSTVTYIPCGRCGKHPCRCTGVGWTLTS